MSLPDVKMAGWACALGLDGMRLVESRDRIERLTVLAVTKHAREARAQMDNELAMRFGMGVK